jgi:hypothetical protein
MPILSLQLGKSFWRGVLAKDRVFICQPRVFIQKVPDLFLEGINFFLHSEHQVVLYKILKLTQHQQKVDTAFTKVLALFFCILSECHRAVTQYPNWHVHYFSYYHTSRFPRHVLFLDPVQESGRISNKIVKQWFCADFHCYFCFVPAEASVQAIQP